MVAGKDTVKVTKKALEDLKKRAASLANMEKEKARPKKQPRLFKPMPRKLLLNTRVSTRRIKIFLPKLKS